MLRRPALFLFAAICASAVAQTSRDVGWPTYGSDPGGTRYSPAQQIDRSNVSKLQLAWTYRTGAFPHDEELDKKAAFEATPILLEGKLFLSTPYDQVIALNAVTGAKLWEFDPKLELPYGASEVTSRGVAAWIGPRVVKAPCDRRIFIGTVDARLIALDADSGKPCSDFGTNGEVDLTNEVKLRDPGDYEVTSAPAIYRDLVITGSSIGDNRAVTLERGIVRAFDVHTGKLRWTWDPIAPWAYQTTPRTGAGNAWSTLSVDVAHGLVFIPTGSASPDYYGGIRKGANKWANSVAALRAATGEFVWGFQVVHHDLWDYDVASQPTLFTWKDGTPAIAITTKMGRVFVLNRLTGASLFPVEERSAPKSDIPGEETWPTQPASISTEPETLSVNDAWGKDEQDRQWCEDKIKAANTGEIFTPPSVQGTLVYPGNVGGVNWGSAAYDPTRHLLIADANRLAFFIKLIPRDQFQGARDNATTSDRLHGEFARQTGAPFGLYRTPFFSPSGLPCTAPPWGTVMAIDLFSGKKTWDVPLGSWIPGKKTGTIALGGPMVTAGGLVFTAAALDNFLRAFDADSGKEVWKYELPAGGQATPMTYVLNGKQYIVIAAGGHGKLGTKQGDYVLAFTLP
jgi:quinoprotein glucose dehydrogenase